MERSIISGRRVYLPVLISLVLFGAWLRFAGLAVMENMLHHDEAFNAWDTIRLIEAPHLTPFLPDNNGRESGWNYLLIPFLLLFDSRPITVRLPAMFTGILTVAAVYRLGDQLMNRRAAVWSAGTLAVLYWHVHISHLGLRAILFPLVGTLAFTALLRGQQKNRTVDWIMAGAGIGLLSYTYLAARLWILYAGLWLAWWFISQRQVRKGTIIAGGVAIVVSLPQLFYMVFNQDAQLTRAGDVAVLSGEGLWTNLISWGLAWFNQGDATAMFNPSSRPILDPFLGILFVAGLIALFRAVRRRSYLVFLLGLIIVSLIPSLFSDYSPHSLRAIGLVIPIALIGGAGAWGLEDIFRKVVNRPLAALVPLGLLLSSGITTGANFQEWVSSQDIYNSMETHVNTAANYVRQDSTTESPLYISPFTPIHPNINVHAKGLEPRRVIAYNSHQCLIIPEEPATYITLTIYEPSFADHLGEWSQISKISEAEVKNDQGIPQYTIYAGESMLEETLNLMVDAPTFGDFLEIRYSSLPESARAGDTIPVTLAFRTLNRLPLVYSAFIHVYDDTPPEEGGILWTQSDSLLCESYQTPGWQPGETIIQTFDLSFPAEMPPGLYTLNVGIYESPVGPRIPLTGPTTNPEQYFEIGQLEVK